MTLQRKRKRQKNKAAENTPETILSSRKHTKQCIARCKGKQHLSDEDKGIHTLQSFI